MAQKLKFGNGTWATKEGSTLAYNDENNNYKPLPFTTTRNSIATRVNKEGLIEVVGKDKPRIDYTDSADGVLLLEPQRTNLIPYSKDFSNSGWTKNNTTVTSGFTSPDGTNSAYKMTDNATDNKHGVYDIDVLSQDGNVYTRSVFVKKGTARYVVLSARHLPTSSGTSWIYDFDINNWVLIGSTGAGQLIEDYGNGWIRLSISHISNSNFNNDFSIGISSGATISDATYSGSGDTLYIYGAQAEQGSYPTSYIPTSGSSVQRAADTASGAGNSEVFNDSEGVLFADVSALAQESSTRYLSLNDGTTSNRIRFGYTTPTNSVRLLVVASSAQVDITKQLSDTFLFNKFAIKYKQNDFSLWANGFEIGVDTSGNTPSGISEFDFDNAAGGDDFYGKTKEIGYYDTALTDEELEYITSYRSLNELVTVLNLNEL